MALTITRVQRVVIQLTPKVKTLSVLGVRYSARGLVKEVPCLLALSNPSCSYRTASSIAPMPPFSNGCLGLTLLSLLSPVTNHVPATYHALPMKSERSWLRLLCSLRCSRDCIHSALSDVGPGDQSNCAPSRCRRPLT